VTVDAVRISGTPAQGARVGSLYTFRPIASDSARRTLSYSIKNKPVWASFSFENGTLSGTPLSSESGSYVGIVISASDGNANAALPAFSIMVSPSPPLATATPPAQGQPHVVVPAASSVQLSQSNASWSLAAGSVGTITANGLYTAPAHVDVQHPVNGVQTLPSDHVYFAPIKNLPLTPNNAKILSVMHANPGPYVGAGAGIIPYFHVNVLDNTLAPVQMTFLYTGVGAANNFDGPYQFLSGNEPESPWYGVPGEWTESGIYESYRAAVDRHIFGVNIDTGMMYEVYNTHPIGTDSRNPASNAVSGTYYSLTTNPYNIGPGTVAGGQLLGASMMTAHEIRVHKIRHLSFFTLPNGTIAGGSNCPCFIWPATARAYAGGSYVPYGARFRLDASVDTVNNPATGKPFSPEAQAVFQAWKDYGIMLSDGGIDGQIEVDADILEDPALGLRFLFEVNNSKSADGKKVADWSHWNVVDESSLEPTGKTGWLSGQVNQANLYYHPAFATATATDKTTKKQTAYPIILQGVTVGVPNGVETIQSGLKVQMQSWVRGTQNTTVHWSMDPALGTLTEAGQYTAPAVTAPTSTLLTATSDADPQASTTVRVMVFPAGGVYMRLGLAGVPYEAAPFTDSKGHVWQTEFTGRVGYGAPSNFDEWGKEGNPHGPGTQWPANLTDWQIWQWQRHGEMEFRFRVPNGTYNVTLYMGIGGVGNTIAPHTYEQSMECEGQTMNPDYDFSVAGGGVTGVPLRYTMTCTVTNGDLDFGVHGVVPANQTAGTSPREALNAFSIEKQ